MIKAKCDIVEVQKKLVTSQEQRFENLEHAVTCKVQDTLQSEMKSYSAVVSKSTNNANSTPRATIRFNSAHIEGKKLAREIIAEEDRQRNVIIRGYTLEGLAANDDDNVGSENRSYSHAPIAVDYLITNGLKEPSLTDSVQKVTLVGKPYFSPSSKYDDKVPNEDGEDHRKQTVKVTFTTKARRLPVNSYSYALTYTVKIETISVNSIYLLTEALQTVRD